MNQNNNGEKELKASEEEIFDSLLDSYENSIGLPSIPKGMEFTCIKYIYYANEDFKKMSSEDCAEACVLLNSFSFHLSRLLKKEKSSSLKELQKLAANYQELISLQEESKKKKLGANAMYYAITLGKFELASWLTKQNNPISGQSFGDFMEIVMNELTVI